MALLGVSTFFAGLRRMRALNLPSSRNITPMSQVTVDPSTFSLRGYQEREGHRCLATIDNSATFFNGAGCADQNLRRFFCINKTHQRYFSTNSTPKKTNESETSNIILFDRAEDRHSYTVAQAGVILSTLNISFWTFYNVYFMPAMNASPMTELHVDETVAGGGLLMAVLISGLGLMHPQSLVSRLEYNTKDETLLLYNHTLLPLVKPALKKPKLVTPVGDLILPTSTRAAKQLVDELNGDLTKVVGMIPLTGKNAKIFPYLLDIRFPEDVTEPQLLFAALLYPEGLSSMVKPQSQTARKAKEQAIQSAGKRGRPYKVGRRRR